MAKTKTAAKSTKTKASTKKTPAKKTAPKRSAAKKAAPKKAASKKAKTSAKAAARKKPSKAKKATDEEVKLDRRRSGRRSEERAEANLDATVENGAADAGSAQPKLERRQKTNRRRQIDPTTCERDYSDGEVEFMNALDNYKRTSGRMFPTCSEVLEVIRDLGYTRLSPAELAEIKARRGETEPSADATIEDAAESEALGALEDSASFREE